MGQDDSGELDAMPLNELLIYYLNWAGRLVDRRPRRAHLSPALTDGPEYRAQRNLVDAIVVEIETGEDLTPRLSKRIEQRYIPSAKAVQPQSAARFGPAPGRLAHPPSPHLGEP